MTGILRGADASPGRPGAISELDSPGGSLRLLRIAWLLWLGSFLVLYAYPALFFQPWIGPFGISFDDAGQPMAGFHTGADWSWDLALWGPMALAVVVPEALYLLLARRVGCPFFLFFVSMLFAVAVYHVPLTRRVLGRPPRITHPRG